jgi:hypothetical protein
VVYAQNLETSGKGQQLAAGEAVRVTWRPEHSFVIPSDSPDEEE